MEYVVQDREFLCVHNLQVGELQPAIHMRVYRRLADRKIIIEQSHFLKTAIQYLPHAVNELPQEDLNEALAQLDHNILNFYEQAVNRDYKPSNDWLVPNTSYKEE